MSDSCNCLTRLVIDARDEIDVAQLQLAVERIQAAIRPVVPPAHRASVGKALLDYALAQVLRAGADSQRRH